MRTIDWSQILRDIHETGFSWIGLGRYLWLAPDTIEGYANDGKPVKMPFVRGMKLLRLYEVLCPEGFARVKPMIDQFASTLPPDDAVRRCASR